MNALVRRGRFVVVALVGALALALAPALPGYAAGPGTVTVTVTADGQPVASTGVSLQGADFRFAFTDPSGVAVFSDLALGDYTLTAQASGTYRNTSTTLSLSAEEPGWSGVVALEPWPVGTASLTVTVLDSVSAAPVDGMHVSVSRIDDIRPAFDGTTGPAGGVTFEGLVAGRYSVGTDSTPDYLGTGHEVTIADGQAATLTVPVLAADAAITGRVVDADGAGIPGVFVNATFVGDGSFGSIGGITDDSGSYLMDDAATGTWTVTVLPDTTWEGATTAVAVTAGSTATADDLVLRPRTTGQLAGLVASSDGIPESTTGGFIDVCATAVDPDGSPVPGATVTTGGDSLFWFLLEPGDYTVYFEDCAVDRQPHGYQPVYLGGSTTLAEATFLHVETLADVWADTTTLFPALGDPEPDHDAIPARLRDLTSAQRDLIAAPDTVVRDETATIAVGAEHAGDWVSVWLHSRPTQLGGWLQVAADGTVEVGIPHTHPAGIHVLVVQDATDAVIGWTDVRVRPRAACPFPRLRDCD